MPSPVTPPNTITIITITKSKNPSIKILHNPSQIKENIKEIRNVFYKFNIFFLHNSVTKTKIK